jgi:N-acyl homoserine lactone hydrolase
MTHQLYAFTCGWLTLSTSFFLEGAEGKVTVPVPAYLIDHPKDGPCSTQALA